MKNTFEVELRSLLSKHQEQELTEYCEQHGKKISVDNRFLVDYSTFLDGGVRNRTIDIRARSTNGKMEIIIKQGSFADSSRLEKNLDVSGSLQDLLTVMALLGYKKAVAAIRNITRFQLGEIEVAITEVRDFSNPNKIHSVFTEFEILTSKSDQKDAESRLVAAMKKINLEPLTDKQWYEYVETLNKEANGVFDYDKADWDKLEKLGK